VGVWTPSGVAVPFEAPFAFFFFFLFFDDDDGGRVRIS
jgi:hypothetical protein